MRISGLAIPRSSVITATHHPALAESEGEKTSGVLTQSWSAGAAVEVEGVSAVMIVRWKTRVEAKERERAACSVSADGPGQWGLERRGRS